MRKTCFLWSSSSLSFMRLNFRYQIRRWHRYLGLFAGLQFLAWSLGGLYFTWSNMDEIHGDFQRAEPPTLAWQPGWVSPDQVLSQLPAQSKLLDFKVVNVLGQATYQVKYQPHLSAQAKGHGHQAAGAVYQLADARTGQFRPSLTKEEAIQMAQDAFIGHPTVQKVELVTDANINGHHEYRESPLPAWAVTMAHPTNTTVYVAAALGSVTKFRNDKWRVFDFLWMLHTMDYQTRDHIGNWLLRVFSIMGVLTVMSGLVLYGSSSRLLRQKKTQAQAVPSKKRVPH
jgi:1,2-phenylacetyl-CoA epoxidase PaaB subunit